MVPSSSARESSPPSSARVVSPPGLPLLGHAYIAYDFLGAAERFRKLGDVVKLRIPPYDVYVLNHPRDIEQLLVQEHERFRKDWTTRILEHILGQGLLVNEGASWRKQRRIVQPELTPRRIESYIDNMAECAERSVRRLRPRGRVNLHAELMLLTLDIAGQTLFGADMGSVASEIDTILEQFIRHYLGFFGTGVRLPDWLPTKANRRAQRNLARLHEIVGEVVRARRRSGAQGNDLLSRLNLGARRARKGHA